MGRKYYCDFCDKAFADNPTNRRNHTRGIQHQRLRNEHYSSHKDAAKLYADEIKKIPCRNFFSRGECKFGAACIFTHYSPEELQNMLKQSQEPTMKRNAKNQPEPNLEDWLKKWRTKHRKADSDSSEVDANSISKNRDCSISKDSKVNDIILPVYQIPSVLQGFVPLPPSLIPPPPDALKELVIEDWG